jgi:hypothetical protein
MTSALPQGAEGPRDLIDTPEAARMIGRTASALRQMRHLGKPTPPAYRIGTKILYSRAEVLAWIAAQAEPREDGIAVIERRPRRAVKKATYSTRDAQA